MTDDTILKLGKLIEGECGRDAIHIAVAPVFAAERLSPGQHIGLIGADHAGRTETPVGIVDPFLQAAVMKGDRFFLFLYPATITSLRHEWTHPAFSAQSAKALDGGEFTPRDAKAESEAWLRAWIDAADCPDYETVMKAIAGEPLENPDPDSYGDSWGRYDGDALFFSGRDAHSSIPIEFWNHAEIVLGRSLRHKPEYFSCSC